MELSSPKLKKFLIFQEGTCNVRKTKIVCLLRENFSNISAKEKFFLYFHL